MAEAKVLTRANIAEAKSAIDTYVSNCAAIFQDLQGTLSALRAENWIGDGSDGCNEFFTTRVVPALEQDLPALAQSLKDILDNVEETIIGQMDPQIGAANRNPDGPA
jgi:hypothetical protein